MTSNSLPQYNDNNVPTGEKFNVIVLNTLAAFAKKFDTIDEKFTAIDRRFDVLEQRFDVLEQRFDLQDRRIDGLGNRLTTQISELDKRLAGRIDKLRSGLTKLANI